MPNASGPDLSQNDQENTFMTILPFPLNQEGYLRSYLKVLIL